MAITIHTSLLLCTVTATRIAVSADDSPVFATAMHKLHSGGTSRAFRGMCVISVALAERPAGIK